MKSIGPYLSTRLHSKMLVAPAKNLTDGETEIEWFEIMTCRAIRGEWINFEIPLRMKDWIVRSTL